MTTKITFRPSGLVYEAQKGEYLLQAAEKAGVMINGSCGGKASCGKCKVKLLSGQAGQLEPEEQAVLSDVEKAEGFRLSCCAKAWGEEMTVWIPDIHGGSSRKKDMILLPEDFEGEETVRKKTVWVKPASLENQRSDQWRLRKALGREADGQAVRSLGLSQLRRLHGALETEDGFVTVTLRNGRILDVEPGDTESRCFGVAFDIGTTTVVGMLWDLNRNERIAALARTNPQSMYGADVISRIHHADLSAENLQHMQKKVIDCFNEMIAEFATENGVESEHIYEVTVVGNTTMSHLFLAVNPAQLAKAPFAPVFCSSFDTPASQLGIRIFPEANVHLLPNIAGHVGSDIVAVLLASRLTKKAGTNLAVDIGTNGEILVAKNGRVLTCSTAAGPAFEGAQIRHGMRAAQGAIEGVFMGKGDVEISVIGDVEPIGICGSGLIDAVAQLLRMRIVDGKGKLKSREAALAAGIPFKLSQRLYKDEDGSGFILFHREGGENIVLTQKDIREVQLAKGAIVAGIKILMDTLGEEAGDLNTVILAGAFGNYIKKESALGIGLLPAVPEERIISVGNAAGAGACMALLSDGERAEACRLAVETEHVELAAHPDFQDEFLKAMYFTV